MVRGDNSEGRSSGMCRHQPRSRFGLIMFNSSQFHTHVQKHTNTGVDLHSLLCHFLFAFVTTSQIAFYANSLSFYAAVLLSQTCSPPKLCTIHVRARFTNNWCHFLSNDALQFLCAPLEWMEHHLHSRSHANEQYPPATHTHRLISWLTSQTKGSAKRPGRAPLRPRSKLSSQKSPPAFPFPANCAIGIIKHAI